MDNPSASFGGTALYTREALGERSRDDLQGDFAGGESDECLRHVMSLLCKRDESALRSLYSLLTSPLCGGTHVLCFGNPTSKGQSRTPVPTKIITRRSLSSLRVAYHHCAFGAS